MTNQWGLVFYEEDIENFINLKQYATYFSNLENCNENEIKDLIKNYPLLITISKTSKPDYLQLVYFEEVAEKSKEITYN